jgi:hypothetical protein
VLGVVDAAGIAGAHANLDAVPTTGLLCFLLDRWGADRLLRLIDLSSVEELLALARKHPSTRVRWEDYANGVADYSCGNSSDR